MAMVNAVKRTAGTMLYWLNIVLPFVVAIIGLILVGFSADIMDLRNRTSHIRYPIQTWGWNSTTDKSYTVEYSDVLGHPSNIDYTSFIATLSAGMVCTIVGAIVGSLVLSYRYSLFKLQLANSPKYSWVFPTCVTLDVLALIIVNDIAVVAGLKEGLGNRYSRWFLFDKSYMLDLAPSVPNYNLWMYAPPNQQFTVTQWTCTFRNWVKFGHGHGRFDKYCNESQAAIPLLITLAGLVTLMTGMHIGAWVHSYHNKSPTSERDGSAEDEA